MAGCRIRQEVRMNSTTKPVNALFAGNREVKRLAGLLAFMIGTHTAMALATDFDRKEFVRDVGHARQLAAQGKQSEGIAYWEKLRPRYGGAQGQYENALGDLYSNAKMYDKAEKTYLQGIALQGKFPNLYTGLAFVYLHTDRPAEAEKWAKRATSEFPKWWQGYYTLGEIARKGDRPQDAKVWLKKSVEVEPQPVTYWLMAMVAYDLKDYQSVVSSMEQAINRDKQYLGDQYGMKASAISLARLGRYKDAYRAVEILKKNNPKVTQAETQAIIDDVKTIEQSGAAKKS